MLRVCSLGWWSTARPTSPHFKHIYPTFSKLWRTPHHPLHMVLMASIHSEWSYLQFLEPRNALETSSNLTCPTEKLLLCLKQEHCSSLSLIFSLFCCPKRCSSWTSQQHSTSNFLPVLFLLPRHPPTDQVKNQLAVISQAIPLSVCPTCQLPHST